MLGPSLVFLQPQLGQILIQSQLPLVGCRRPSLGLALRLGCRSWVPLGLSSNALQPALVLLGFGPGFKGLPHAGCALALALAVSFA